MKVLVDWRARVLRTSCATTKVDGMMRSRRRQRRRVSDEKLTGTEVMTLDESSATSVYVSTRSSTPFWQMNNQREHAQIDSRARSRAGKPERLLRVFGLGLVVGWVRRHGVAGTLPARIVRFGRYRCVRSRASGAPRTPRVPATPPSPTTPGTMVRAGRLPLR